MGNIIYKFKLSHKCEKCFHKVCKSSTCYILKRIHDLALKLCKKVFVTCFCLKIYYLLCTISSSQSQGCYPSHLMHYLNLLWWVVVIYAFWLVFPVVGLMLRGDLRVQTGLNCSIKDMVQCTYLLYEYRDLGVVFHCILYFSRMSVLID